MNARTGTRIRPEAGFKLARRRGYLRLIGKQKYLIMMVIPGLVVIFLFRYLPMYGIVVAFKNYSIGRGILESPWVGLKWFKLFFSNPLAWRLIRNTFMLGLWSLIFDFPDSIILALLLNEVRSSLFKRSVQTVTYLPHFISMVIMVGILQELASLNGGFNEIVKFFGADPIHFFARPQWFRPLFTLSNVWRSIGWGTIIYLAALSGVDPQLYEAAIIDGAGRWRQMINITVPAILPTVTILLILRIGHLLEVNYQSVLLMYNPRVYETADIIGTYVFREGIQNARFSYATAIGLFMSLISFALVFMANWFSKRTSDTSLW